MIEAHWLFGLDYDRIDALLHPQSIIHGLVEFTDGTVTAEDSHLNLRDWYRYLNAYLDPKSRIL